MSSWIQGEGSTNKNHRYEFLDSQKRSAEAVKAANADADKQFEEALRQRANGINMEKQVPWIYMNDIEGVWREYVAKREGDEAKG